MRNNIRLSNKKPNDQNVCIGRIEWTFFNIYQIISAQYIVEGGGGGGGFWHAFRLTTSQNIIDKGFICIIS